MSALIPSSCLWVPPYPLLSSPTSPCFLSKTTLAFIISWYSLPLIPLLNSICSTSSRSNVPGGPFIVWADVSWSMTLRLSGPYSVSKIYRP